MHGDSCVLFTSSVIVKTRVLPKRNTMSGEWEVVGKNKQKQSGQTAKKLSKSEKKKFIENAPKVEDIRMYYIRWTICNCIKRMHIYFCTLIVFPSNHYQDMQCLTTRVWLQYSIYTNS